MSISRTMASTAAFLFSCAFSTGVWSGPVADAAKEGDLEQLKALIAQGANADEDGIAAPLFYAARSGHTETVTYLIEQDVDLNRLSKWGTALQVASRRGHVEIAELFLENGADPNIAGGVDERYPIHEAAVKGGNEIVSTLIEHGADVNRRDGKSAPAIHEAARKGHREVVDLLRDAGAMPLKVEPIGPRLAEADLEAGRLKAIECTSCHAFEEGKLKDGPNLWGLVGRSTASLEAYPYSDAMKGLDASWDYEALNAFLADPKGYAPGTSMDYSPITGEAERANVIAYLRTLDSDPKPLP